MGLRTAIAALLLSPGLAFAWGNEGHQIVALIAYAHLTPEAKAATKELLGKGADIYDAEVADWPDTIRRAHPDTGSYHYVGADVGREKIDLAKDGKKGKNVVDGITNQAAILAGDTTAPPIIIVDKGDSKTGKAEPRSEALRWVVHLVGDAHQPLHCCDRNNDAGGNGVAVLFENRKTETKLHAVWDTDMLRTYVSAFLKAEKKRTKETAELTDYAMALDAKIKPADAKKWAEGTPLDWANESHAAGIKLYAALPAGDPVKIDQAYVEANQDVIEGQLERGGIRLAAVLNKSLGKPVATRQR